MKLKENDIYKEYNLFKQHANRLFSKKDFELCLKYIDLCAKIGYTFNFLFADVELENLLLKIGNQIIKNKELATNSDRYVFYDCFGLDNRGLTQQYIRGLMALDKEFLYILNSESPLDQSRDIMSELRRYGKATVYILNKVRYLDKIQEVEQVLMEYRPGSAFLHMSPADVVGVTLWNQIKISRYFINLTDHAFWLGINSADYFFEFRPLGCKISSEARGISKNKLRLLPYYPILNERSFSGFPVDVSGKVIGFSGAAFYKIYGRGGFFFTLIKRALDENQNFIFLLAGSGDAGPINRFIKENGFENRFILLGNRRDINAVFRNIDIYINTYPVIGALMTQYAVVDNKPLITYTSPDLAANYIENFLLVDKTKVKSMFTENDFSAELNKLIRSKDYRLKNVENYKDSVPTPQEFNDHLKMHLSGTVVSEADFEDIDIDYKAIQNLYLETESDYLNSFDLLKLSHLKSCYFRSFPMSGLKTLFRVLYFQKGFVKRVIRRKLSNAILKHPARD